MVELRRCTNRSTARYPVSRSEHSQTSRNLVKKRGCIYGTLHGTNISPLKVAGKMIFLFHRWYMLVIRRVVYIMFSYVFRGLLKCVIFLTDLLFFSGSCLFPSNSDDAQQRCWETTTPRHPLMIHPNSTSLLSISSVVNRCVFSVPAKTPKTRKVDASQ